MTTKSGSSRAKKTTKATTSASSKMAAMAAAPIANSYSTGDFTISWTISGTNFGNCQITVSLQGKQVQSRLFTSGNSNFPFPTTSYGGDTLDLTVAYQPPSATAFGVLMIISMKLQQLFGGTITQSNVQLVGWDQNGNVQQPSVTALSRTVF